jgi:hypothetical protein
LNDLLFDGVTLRKLYFTSKYNDMFIQVKCVCVELTMRTIGDKWIVFSGNQGTTGNHSSHDAASQFELEILY